MICQPFSGPVMKQQETRKYSKKYNKEKGRGSQEIANNPIKNH